MKNHILTILSFLTISISLYATRDNSYDVNNIPPELIKNADAVIRNDYIELKVSNTFSATQKVEFAVTIFNSKSSLEETYIYYNKYSKVKETFGYIYDASGNMIKKLNKSDFSDISAVSGGTLHSDGRFKVLSTNYNKYPYTIKVTYTIEHKGFLYYPDWHILSDYRTASEQSIYRLILSKDIKIRHKAMHIDIEPEIEEKERQTIYTWQTQNIKSIRKEVFSPHKSKLFPKVKIEPVQFQIDNYKGNMSSWKSIGKFMYELNKGRDILSPQMQQKVKTITARATTKREKIDLLYKYLQENTRYVSIQLGIGGWQTFNAEYVEKNEYGDCKALTNYMMSMLKVIDITAYPALVYANNVPKQLDEEFSHFLAFNHVILYVPMEDEPLWLECTSSHAPSGYLSSFTENRQVLLVTPEGGKLAKTPIKTEKHHRQIQQAKVVLNEKGEANANILSKNYDDEHDFYRYIYHGLSEEEQHKRIRKNLDLPSFTFDKIDIKVYDNQPRADLQMTITIPRYASKAGTRLFLYPNLLNRRSYIPSEMKNRANPIERQIGYTHEDSIFFQIPPDYTIENIPYKDFKLSTEFGTYQIKATVENNQLIYVRTLEMYAFSLPKERYNDLRDFYAKIVKIDNMKIVLVKGKA